MFIDTTAEIAFPTKGTGGKESKLSTFSLRRPNTRAADGKGKPASIWDKRGSASPSPRRPGKEPLPVTRNSDPRLEGPCGGHPRPCLGHEFTHAPWRFLPTDATILAKPPLEAPVLPAGQTRGEGLWPRLAPTRSSVSIWAVLCGWIRFLLQPRSTSETCFFNKYVEKI